ncbi:flavin-containing monooxygenase [Saccharopolyspora sp. MS10]|uniref:flavin-containing monooxygenase n=1 Tax=Saccharopolyspora sp. MS10 TaxID=3385973 RepID=UPI0039A19E45
MRSLVDQARAHPRCAGGREIPVAVIGAGPSGLAVAAELERRGIPATVFERSGQLGASWRDRYDGLRLHAARSLSALPGLRLPRSRERWVSRDDLVRYLEAYVAHHELDVRLSTRVERIRPVEHDGGARSWRLCTGGTTAAASTVVVATGRNQLPHVPDWPGADAFPGELIHSTRYRGPQPCAGRDVLVVGSGNSGAQIAVALAEGGASRVRWSVRTPPNLVPATTGRLQRLSAALNALPPGAADLLTAAFTRLTLPDLTSRGVPRPQEGPRVRARRDGTSPVHDQGIVAAVLDGRVEPVAAVTAIEREQVVLADGSRISPDRIVAATGFRPGLERMFGAGPLLTGQGLPVPGGVPEAPNLHFVGFTHHPSEHVRQVGREARTTARTIARGLRRAGGPNRTIDCRCTSVT